MKQINISLNDITTILSLGEQRHLAFFEDENTGATIVQLHDRTNSPEIDDPQECVALKAVQKQAKKIVKLVKESKMKVQASIQGPAVRISGAKRDDLQAAIQMVRDSVKEIPLQFGNFRD